MSEDKKEKTEEVKDEEIKEAIMNDASSIQIRKIALEQNYKPLVIDGINKIIKGETNVKELNNKLLIF